MEIIIEFLLDLIFDLGVEASKSRKIPKPIRIILACIISLVFFAVFGLVIFLGIAILKNNVIAGVFIILFGIVMMVLGIIKFIRTYVRKIGDR